jgi:osomolarity two-component system sensor histidine kinase SLN1
MDEDDMPRIKRSLQVVYKSGDLLLHLLNDLLTFSKNQIGQQLSLEEKEFRLADIKTQILTIFMKQVQEKNINFGVRFIGTDVDGDSSPPSEKVLPALGPQGTGRLKDMW